MRSSPNLLAALTASAAALFLCAVAGAPAPGNPDAPTYDRDGRLIAPAEYRDWVFLSSGVDMSYSESLSAADAHVFDNVFAPPAAYAAFKRTGVWPDKTLLMLENRGGEVEGLDQPGGTVPDRRDYRSRGPREGRRRASRAAGAFFAIQGESGGQTDPLHGGLLQLPRGPWRSGHDLRAVLPDTAACRNCASER